METELKLFIGFFVPLQVTSILLCFLLVYCFYAVQMIRKPPGSLMLGQIILIYVVHMVQGVYICVLFFDDSSRKNKALTLTLLELIGFYVIACYSNYEICILIELYKRITGNYTGKAYGRRANIYHIVCHLIAFLFTLISGLTLFFDSPDDGLSVLSYESWALWIFLCYPLIQLSISVVFMSLIASRISKLDNLHTKKFIKKTIFYMAALDAIKLMLIVSMSLREQIYEDMEGLDSNTFMCILVLISMGFDMMIVIFRLRDPYITEFLKQKFRILVTKTKRKFMTLTNTAIYESNTDENMNNLLNAKMFEDINIENIEYQLIALSIAMFKKEDSMIDEHSINMDDLYSNKTTTTEINSNDLYILNCPDTQSKCKIQTDFNYRCEYKQYAPDVFQDILTKESVNLNDIANSLFIEDNRDSIKKFISPEDNRENYLITFDEKYILKTLSKEEHKHFLKHTLKLYHQRIIEDSFLQRIYGLYKLTYKGIQVRVMVQKNHYRCFNQLTEVFQISEKLDLLSRSRIIPAGTTEISIKLSEDCRNRLFYILSRDLEFLKTSKIINYSIKIIHHDDFICSPFTYQAEIHGQKVSLGFYLMNIFTKNKKAVYGIFKKQCEILGCAKKYAQETIHKLDSIIIS